jgi:hypothetical protein
MRKNLLLLAMLAFTTLGFTACSSGDDEPTNEDVVLPTPDFKDDAIKLRLTDPVEFNEEFKLTELELTESGHYLIKLEKYRNTEVKATRAASKSYKYLFDTFSRIAERIYKLVNFGTVTIQAKGNGKYTLILEFNGKSVTVDATLIIANISKGKQTSNLCRSWTIESTRIQIDGEKGFYQENGCDMNSILTYMKQHASIGDEVESDQKVKSLIISENGTFALVYANGNTDKATWSWVSGSTTDLTYTWDASDMGYTFLNGKAQVALKAVGKASQLKLFGSVKNKSGETKPVTATILMK